MFWKKHGQQGTDAPHDVPRCSFCNQRQEKFRRIIAGPPPVFICDECVRVCNDILADDDRFEVKRDAHDARGAQAAGELEPPPAVPSSPGAIRCSLCHLPMPSDEATWIPDRGALCPGCIGEIEAAIARKGEEDP